MKTIMMLLSLLALSCLAQKPQPCTSPPFLSGSFMVPIGNEKIFANYWYDTVGQRIRIKSGFSVNVTNDVLVLYKEHILYRIDESKCQCTMEPLKDDFNPVVVPKDASFQGQYVLGSSSGPGMGVVVDSWGGTDPSSKDGYEITVTDIGCIPVSYTACAWGLMIKFFNNIIESVPPKELDVPDFCHHAPMMRGRGGRQPPADFFSLVLKQK